jgi:hypothetical protein
MSFFFFSWVGTERLVSLVDNFRGVVNSFGEGCKLLFSSFLLRVG